MTKTRTKPAPIPANRAPTRLSWAAEAMALRVHAATVGDTPAFVADRLRYVKACRQLRLWGL